MSDACRYCIFQDTEAKRNSTLLTCATTRARIMCCDRFWLPCRQESCQDTASDTHGSTQGTEGTYPSESQQTTQQDGSSTSSTCTKEMKLLVLIPYAQKSQFKLCLKHNSAWGREAAHATYRLVPMETVSGAKRSRPFHIDSCQNTLRITTLTNFASVVNCK